MIKQPEFKMQRAIRGVGCGLWCCGLWAAGCGLWAVGCGATQCVSVYECWQMWLQNKKANVDG